MNVFIGITQHPENLENKITANSGIPDSLMEVGPFLTREDALAWQTYLSQKLGKTTELTPIQEKDANELWYGFTFEA